VSVSVCAGVCQNWKIKKQEKNQISEKYRFTRTVIWRGETKPVLLSNKQAPSREPNQAILKSSPVFTQTDDLAERHEKASRILNRAGKFAAAKRTEKKQSRFQAKTHLGQTRRTLRSRRFAQRRCGFSLIIVAEGATKQRVTIAQNSGPTCFFRWLAQLLHALSEEFHVRCFV
jgi:hypothetical protein